MTRKTTEGLPINRRLALKLSAGTLIASMVSASLPVGPREMQLRDRLREMRANGLRDIRISWAPEAARLSREERAAAIMAVLDAPIEAIGAPDEHLKPVKIDDWLKTVL